MGKNKAWQPGKTGILRKATMICAKCDKDLSICECDDCAERIRIILNSKYIVFGQEYKEVLERHAKQVEEQQTKIE